MVFLESKCTDAAWNLALEQYVFEQLDHSKEYFMLWQNANTIVVGKNQNTAGEINSDFVREKKIQVVRRLSGGGAVYHDLGNLNFTFITDAGEGEQIDLRRFCILIVETVGSFGVKAMVGGRNDIMVDGKKFSGNAQYIKDGRVMHHGTILFSSDLSVVAQALTVDREKIVSKGIRSVESRVTNLCDHMPDKVSLQDFKERLLEHVMRDEAIETYSLTQKDEKKIQRIKEQRYATWQWNYGRSPSYSLCRKKRFENCGQIEVSLSAEHGRLKDIQFFGDFFGSRELNELSILLSGCRCRKDDIVDRLQGCSLGMYIQNVTAEQLADLIV